MINIWEKKLIQHRPAEHTIQKMCKRVVFTLVIKMGNDEHIS